MTDSNGRRGSNGNIMKVLNSIVGLLRDILAELKKINSRHSENKVEPIVYKSADNQAKRVLEVLEEAATKTNRSGNKGYTNKSRGV